MHSMKVRPHSGQVYVAFDHEISRAVAGFRDRVPAWGGYPGDLVADRLGQRLVELLLPSFAKECIRRRDASETDVVPPPGSVIRGHRLSLETGSAKVRVSALDVLASLLEFLAQWAYALLAISAGIWSLKGKGHHPATLIYGVGSESLFVDGSDQRFAAYCRSGPIVPLNKGTRFLVYDPTVRGTVGDPAFSYVRHPLLALAKQAPLEWKAKLKLLSDHLALPFGFLVGIIKFPMISVLARDFAHSRVARTLAESGAIESVVLTCSNYTIQPLWMRVAEGFETHMVWYALNWRPMVYRADRLASHIPNLHWIRVDTHWVWTERFGAYLQQLDPKAKSRVVGPILWYLPETRLPPGDAIELAVFDVMPFSDEIAASLGELENYWRPAHLTAFIHAVVEMKESLQITFSRPVVLKLKQKRGYNELYDKAYFGLIDELTRSGKIAAVPHSDNMYALISGSHAAIVYPYSSPAYVADYLGVPAVYFDPTGQLQPSYDEAPLICFAQQPEELRSVVSKMVADRLSAAQAI